MHPPYTALLDDNTSSYALSIHIQAHVSQRGVARQSRRLHGQTICSKPTHSRLANLRQLELAWPELDTEWSVVRNYHFAENVCAAQRTPLLIQSGKCVSVCVYANVVQK